ncbi:MAG: hypothetical protein IV105_19270 [Rhizobacter sp.]|nr:hypothetical protein [Rhizobacter sp.]
MSLVIANPDAPSIEDADGFSALCADEADAATAGSAGLPARVVATSNKASRTTADSSAAATRTARVVMMRLPHVTVRALSGEGSTGVLKKA